MTRAMWKWMIVPAAVAAGCLGSGCTALLVGGVAAAAAAGTYVYTEGRLETVEDARLDAVYEGALAAVKDMEFPVKEQRRDALSARVVAERADRTEVKIALERRSDDTTEVRIRVGIVGDEEVSRRVLAKMREHIRAGSSS
jgi:hypothetical protein